MFGNDSLKFLLKGYIYLFNHGMAGHFKFGGYDISYSFFKPKWDFDYKWPGENAHVGVWGKGLTSQKAGRVCSSVRYSKFHIKEADIA